MKLSKAITEYLQAAQAARLSQHTLRNNRITCYDFLRFLDADPDISRISPKRIVEYLESRDDVCNKTLRNYWASLSALWAWAVLEGYADKNIVHKVQCPKAEVRAIIPFTRDDVSKLIHATEYWLWRGKDRAARVEIPMSTPNALRDKAIILTFLDSGVRTSELCGMQIQDIRQGETETWLIKILGKGNKEREVPISNETYKTIQSYRETITASGEKGFVFLSQDGDPMDRNTIRLLMERLSDKAQVQANAHKFRHTFAINFLRNGGNVYELKAILGHSSLEMCQRYLALAETDIERSHLKASPVMAWNMAGG